MAKRKSNSRKIQKPKCGLVMPISECDGLPNHHWSEVKSIIENALASKFDVALVSDREEVGVIHEAMVVNLFENPIVICDVSGRNPNVMLELGIRLAADKPVVIIKDDATKFAFDISPITHLIYPRDLRHQKVQTFKLELAKKALSTFEAGTQKDYSPFLSNFKKYRPKQLESVEETAMETVIRKVEELSSKLNTFVDLPKMIVETDSEMDKFEVASNEFIKQLKIAQDKRRVNRIRQAALRKARKIARNEPELDYLYTNELEEVEIDIAQNYLE